MSQGEILEAACEEVGEMIGAVDMDEGVGVGNAVNQ